MTDRVKQAVANLARTLREIRESSGPAVTRHEDGDFFMFSDPQGTDARPVDRLPEPTVPAKVSR